MNSNVSPAEAAEASRFRSERVSIAINMISISNINMSIYVNVDADSGRYDHRQGPHSGLCYRIRNSGSSTGNSRLHKGVIELCSASVEMTVDQ
jgi:hypothetical protein